MPEQAESGGGALADLAVLDLTEGVAGPFGTKLLADLGARVTKVEPPGGDRARRLAPFAADRPARASSLLFAFLNTNKRSVALDLESAVGRAAARALAARSELIVESWAPGRAEALGLDHATLAAENPRLSYLSVSDFGRSGSYATWRGGEMALLALSGHMHSEGEPDRAPLVYAGLKAQYLGGTYAAAAALAAVASARADGRGRRVDLSTLECLLSCPDGATRLALWEYCGDDSRRNGYRRQGTYPAGVFACADGFVYLTASILAFWPRVAEMLEMPELLTDPRFADPVERPHHHDEFEAMFWGWCADRTMREVFEAAQAARLPSAPVYAPHHVPADPHFRAVNTFPPLNTPVGSFAAPGAPFRAEGLGWRRGRPPRLGEHNAAVLGGLLGLSYAERAGLAAGTRRRVAGSSQGSGGAPAAPPEPRPSPASFPLKGIRILDHGQVYAVPAAAAMLADLGAEVIRVEPISRFPTATRGSLVRPPTPSLGYPDHVPGERPWNRSYFNVLHLNKRSATFELKDELSRAHYLRLVALSDVVLDNYAAGVMARLGLGYEDLRRARPDLIVLSATGFGQHGPYRDYVTFGTAIDAVSGHTYLRGYEGDDPLIRTLQTWPDSPAGATIVFAILAALHRRRRTGEGQFIDLAQAETFLNHCAEALLDWTANDRSRTALGNAHAVYAPHGCYPSLGDDTWITLAVTTDAEWAGLRELLGRPAWAEEPRFRTAIGRLRHRRELDERLAAWTAGQEAEPLMRALQAKGVAGARVLRSSQLVENDHLSARAFLAPVRHPEAGAHRYPRGPWHWDGARLPDPAPAAGLGEHNTYIYGDLLGLPPAEIADLAAKRLIGEVYPEAV
jgi:crotonobetainyl-CoA:carnitine CoA-transferase CaiB-like acyl-CoA transferase